MIDLVPNSNLWHMFNNIVQLLKDIRADMRIIRETLQSVTQTQEDTDD